eukprot:6981333-Pyramimonas_sp.AAC.1
MENSLLSAAGAGRCFFPQPFQAHHETLKLQQFQHARVPAPELLQLPSSLPNVTNGRSTVADSLIDPHQPTIVLQLSNRFSAAQIETLRKQLQGATHPLSRLVTRVVARCESRRDKETNEMQRVP